MGILWTILIGLVAGALAKVLMPGKDSDGILITIVLGIGGALVANFLGQAMGWFHAGEGVGLIGATLGAVLILGIYRVVKGSSTPA